MNGLSIEESEAVLARMADDPKSLKSHDEVADAVLCLVNHWRGTMISKYVDGVSGAPDWLEYEYRIWQLGETLRPFMRLKNWRGENPILDAAADIVTNSNFGKGRQTFALLLGDFGRGAYGESLGKGLTDQEVQGHCLKSLNKAKIHGFATEAELVLENSNGWIRSAAKKYLQNLGQLG